MFNPSAKIIADSVNESGNRITTFVLTFHRFVLPEFATHRMFSKNSASSRAIPVEKMIKLVEESQVEPLHWGANCKGMSAKEEVDDLSIATAKKIWAESRLDAIKHARALINTDIHKQIVNRLLEPFAPITVICTATEYQNFFAQRCHPDAQPEIKALADAMKLEYDASKPFELEAGWWHFPFVDRGYVNEARWNKVCQEEITETLLKISTGRCARVSYLNHDGKRSIEDDIKLHDRLLASQPPHLSPFEHCAMALDSSDKRFNLRGFESYRYQIEAKNNDH